MNAVAPTMLSSSKVPQPELACWWPSSPSASSSAAYSARFSPFMIRCCQSMLTLTLSTPWARSLWITCSVMPMLRMRIFIAGSEFLCSRKSEHAVLLALRRGLADAVDEPRPALAVRRLERVVVALDPRPDDEVRAERGRRSRRVDGDAAAPRRASPRSGLSEAAAPEARVEVQAAGEAVDAVTAERLAHLVEVLLARAPAGSGTRSRRSGRRGPRPRVAPAGPSSRLRARAGSRPGTKRVTIGPNAQMPRLVFIAPRPAAASPGARPRRSSRTGAGSRPRR